MVSQSPAAQVIVPETLVLKQMRPQAPQLVVDVSVAVSQPLVRLESQSACVPSQAGTQTPDPLQVLVPPAAWQATLQPPQLLSLLMIEVSQPLVRLESQSACVLSQEGTQTPAPLQVLVPPVWAQDVLHPPQCASLLKMAVSQPSRSGAALLQLAKPTLQLA